MSLEDARRIVAEYNQKLEAGVNREEVAKVKLGSTVLVQPNRHAPEGEWRDRYVKPPEEVVVTSFKGVGNAMFKSGCHLFTERCVIKVIK